MSQPGADPAPAAGTPLLLPTPGLILIWGAEGAGGPELAARLFPAAHVLRAHEVRRLVGADAAGPRELAREAWSALERLVELRLRAARPTVVELEAWPEQDPDSLAALAKRAALPCHVLALDVPPRRCRAVLPELSPDEASAQRAWFDRCVAALGRRKAVRIDRLRRPEQVTAWLPRRLSCDRREERGPFDLIGDVHGCLDELHELLFRLGYGLDPSGIPRHPEGRRLVFLGDLSDRGPRSLAVVRLALRAIESGAALGVRGNHDDKLARYLAGRKVSLGHGLATTAAELDALDPAERDELTAWAQPALANLPSHLVLDRGALVAVHGGISSRLIGREGAQVDAFALYGAPTGRLDEDGYPERGDWARDYEGPAWVIYGHTPLGTARWQNRTLCIDQGCAFGGALSALRWPERELISVPARRTYAPPRGRFRPRLLAPPVAGPSWGCP